MTTLMRFADLVSHTCTPRVADASVLLWMQHASPGAPIMIMLALLQCHNAAESCRAGFHLVRNKAPSAERNSAVA